MIAAAPEQEEQGGVDPPLPDQCQGQISALRGDSRTDNANADCRILIVEDDFLVAADIEAGLKDCGYHVVGVAATAAEAIALAASCKPVLVIMDIRLAGNRDGIETAVELYREQGLRCIFATAHSDDHARRRAAPANPLGWIQKPYSLGSLLTVIRQVRAPAGGDKGS